MPPELVRLYTEGSGVVFGSDAAARSGRPGVRPTYRTLLRAVRAVPNGPFYTRETSTRLVRALERPDVTVAGRGALRQTMTAALNAAELDWRSGGNGRARSAANSKASTALDDWGSVKLLSGEGEVAMELVSGLPARPRGVRTAWPLASYRLTAITKMPPRAQTEVDLYVGWMNFGGGGETLALAWNGREYRNVTMSFDAGRGRIKLRVGFGERIVIVRTKLCY